MPLSFGVVGGGSGANIGLSDHTGGSMSGVTETKIGMVTLPANLVKTGVLVLASGKVIHVLAPGDIDHTETIRLRCGTNNDGVSNAAQLAITRRDRIVTANNETCGQGWSIAFYVDTLTFSNTNYICITGQADSATNNSTYCETIELIYI